MNIAIIPARGGSKRIPRKNIKQFSGKEIIAYSIEAAIKTKIFDDIIVSTDDEEIAEVSRKYGASIPFYRPKKYSDDFTGTNDVVKHALNWFKDKGHNYEFACCIYATAPFIQSDYLIKGYHMLKEAHKNFAFSVTEFSFPIQRAIKLNKQREVTSFWPECIDNRSQDLDKAYHDAGQFYWGTSAAFLNDYPLFEESSIGVVLPRYLVQDIDTVEDWQQAELMYSAYKQRMNG